MAIFRNLRDQVREAAAKRGIEMQGVAEALGITPASFTRILAHGTATTDKLEAIARALGVSPWTIDEYVALKATELARNHRALLDVVRKVGTAAARSRDSLLQKLSNL